MAIKLIGNYAKRLGLPGYSSHQFSVSVETELTDSGDIQGEATRIYTLLQDAVDREIQDTGFVPGEDYGLHDNGSHRANSNGTQPNGQNRLNGGNGHNGNANGSNENTERWSCSDKQRKLILKLIKENDLDQDTVEEIAHDRFGLWIWQLNRLQASGLISELLESVGKNGSRPNGKGGRRYGAGRIEQRSRWSRRPVEKWLSPVLRNSLRAGGGQFHPRIHRTAKKMTRRKKWQVNGMSPQFGAF